MNRLVPWLPNVCIFFYTRVRGCPCEHSAPLRCLASARTCPTRTISDEPKATADRINGPILCRFCKLCTITRHCGNVCTGKVSIR